MHNHKAMPSHSVWADLDALVLEEVDALGARRRDKEAEEQPEGFGSDDDFLTHAGEYLRLHASPEQLLEQLRNSLELSAEAGESTADELDEADEVPSTEQDAPPETEDEK